MVLNLMRFSLRTVKVNMSLNLNLFFFAQLATL